MVHHADVLLDFKLVDAQASLLDCTVLKHVQQELEEEKHSVLLLLPVAFVSVAPVPALLAPLLAVALRAVLHLDQQPSEHPDTVALSYHPSQRPSSQQPGGTSDPKTASETLECR